MKKRLLCIFLTVLITLSALSLTSVASPDDVYETVYGIPNYVNVIIDGNVINTPDIVIDGTTYLGLRALAEALGYSVEWIEDDHLAMLTSGSEPNLGDEFIQKGVSEELKEMHVLNNYVNAIFLDGNAVGVKNMVMDGRTYLGLRDMGELLGYTVDWDGDTKTAILTKITE